MHFLVFVLELVEAVIDAALVEQFLVRALFAQAALVEYEDAVGVLNGAEAVGDDDRGAAGEQAIERFANHHLGASVHAGGGFVEDEELGIVRQGAREADQLALADGKRGTALVDDGVETLGQGIEEMARGPLRAGRGRRRAIDGCGAEANVGFERAGEQEGVLQHDAELAPQILDVQFADIDAVEKDLAALDVVEAQQELNGGGFAGAGVADDGDGLTGLDAEGDVAQDPIVFAGIGAAAADRRRRRCGIRFRRARGREGVPHRRPSGGSGSSSSVKMRSEAAMAACRILNLSLRS